MKLGKLKDMAGWQESVRPPHLNQEVNKPGWAGHFARVGLKIDNYLGEHGKAVQKYNRSFLYIITGT